MERDGAIRKTSTSFSHALKCWRISFTKPEAGQNIIPVYLPKNLEVIDMDGQSYDPADMNLSRIARQMRVSLSQIH